MTPARAGLPADSSAGWVLLLPAPRPDTRVLCLELNAVRNAESLAYWHERVTALTRIGDETVRTEFTAGTAAPEVREAWRAGAPLPFADHSFDVVVCRFIGGTGAPAGLSLAALAGECARVARASASIYLDVANPASYHRIGAWLRGRRSDPARPASAAPLARALRARGFEVRRRAFTTERGAIADVLPAQGYRPTRNAWSRAERAKSLLLSRHTAGLFAAAFGLVAHRGTWQPNILSAFGAREFDTCFVNPGKSFVRFGDAMFVVPADAAVVARRRREVRALDALTRSGLALARLVPRVAREIDLAGRPAFEYEAIAGATIDTPTDDFAALIGRACELLVAFNRESCHRITVSDAEFDLLVGAALDSAARWYPAHAATFERLRARFRGLLHGCEIPVVWLHGDYKLENLIIAEHDRSVRAVIDWELGVPVGLPLCDLFYLLIYQRITTGDAADVLECVQQPLFDDQWSATEKEMLANYVESLRLPAGLQPIAAAVFVIHHVGLRFRYAREDAAAALLPAVLALLESRLAQAQRP